MNEEEKKAINDLIDIKEFGNLSSYLDLRKEQLKSIDIALNLIEKQQKEIEELKEEIKDITSIPQNDIIYDEEGNEINE